MTPRCLGPALTALLVAALSAAVLAGPAQADARPKARTDRVTLFLGDSVAVDVLANDRVAAKGRARVRLVGYSSTVSATVVHRRVLVTARASEVPGRATVTYDVTDRSGRTTRSSIRVTRIPVPPGPPR